MQIGRRPAEGLQIIRRNPSFALLLVSTGVSSAGDGLYVAAIQLLAAQTTQSSQAIAAVRAATMLPPVIFTLLSGVAADRIQRKRLMLAADLMRGSVVLVFSMVVFRGVAQMWPIYLIAITLGSLQTLFDSASQALIPQIVSKDVLERANSWLMGVWTLGISFVGPALGGVVFSISRPAPFLADAASFFASACAIFYLRVRVKAGATREDRRRKAFICDIFVGLRYVLRERVLVNIILLSIIVSVSLGTSASVFVIFAIRQLSVGPVGYGMLLVCESIGGIAGSLIAARVRPPDRRLAVGIALPCLGLANVVKAYTHDFWLAGAMVIAGNVAYMIWVIIAAAARQATASDHVSGRVASVYRLCTLSAQGVGAILGGYLVTEDGVWLCFLLSGVAICLAGILAFHSLADWR